MKTIFFIHLVLFFSTTYNSYSQSLESHMQNAYEKSVAKDYKSAIYSYTKALEIDSNNAEIYYSRGTISLMISDFNSALIDFNKSLAINKNNPNALYNRAGLFAQTQKFQEALNDLNQLIESYEKFPGALTLRGQMKFFTNDTKGCCNDFQKAKDFGDKDANSYLSKYCANLNNSAEFLNLVWPESENWKIESSQENEIMKMEELLKDGEKFENWTEIGTLITYKNQVAQDVEAKAKMLFEETKQKSSNSVFKVIELNKRIEFPYIIFSIEVPQSQNINNPESQLWIIMQGNKSLYLADRAIKAPSIPKATLDNWTTFFKTAKILVK